MTTPEILNLLRRFLPDLKKELRKDEEKALKAGLKAFRDRQKALSPEFAAVLDKTTRKHFKKEPIIKL